MFIHNPFGLLTGKDGENGMQGCHAISGKGCALHARTVSVAKFPSTFYNAGFLTAIMPARQEIGFCTTQREEKNLDVNLTGRPVPLGRSHRLAFSPGLNIRSNTFHSLFRISNSLIYNKQQRQPPAVHTNAGGSLKCPKVCITSTIRAITSGTLGWVLRLIRAPTLSSI